MNKGNQAGRKKERQGVMKQREIDSDLESRVKTKGSQGDGKEKQGREVSTEVSCQWTIASEKWNIFVSGNRKSFDQNVCVDCQFYFQQITSICKYHCVGFGDSIEKP